MLANELMEFLRKFKNYSVNILPDKVDAHNIASMHLKTTQLIFYAHKIKLHNIYQSLYS